MARVAALALSRAAQGLASLASAQLMHGPCGQAAAAAVLATATLQAAAAGPPRRAYSSKSALQAAQRQAMATYWRSILSSARAFGAARPAALLLGTAATAAGVWAAQAEWRRQQHRSLQAASGAAEPSPVPHASSSPAATSAANECEADSRLRAFQARFVLEAGAGMIPHPAKVDRGGEDAYFICDRGFAMGVADGVGGWAEVGVDPGLYSRELMRHAKAATTSCEPGPHCPQHLMEVAYLSTTARGSSTACILCLENERLHASNLGDSGFMVIRDGELLFMSPQQQHEFNFPYQIGSPDSMSDTPAVAQRFSVEVRPGDIVVAATDGLFDNVYPDEAASLVSAGKERGESAQQLAVSLAQFARMRAADPTHLSPFAYGAQQLGYRYFGGKMDDITVVVGLVSPVPGATNGATQQLAAGGGGGGGPQSKL